MTPRSSKNALAGPRRLNLDNRDRSRTARSHVSAGLFLPVRGRSVAVDQAERKLWNSRYLWSYFSLSAESRFMIESRTQTFVRSCGCWQSAVAITATVLNVSKHSVRNSFSDLRHPVTGRVHNESHQNASQRCFESRRIRGVQVGSPPSSHQSILSTMTQQQAPDRVLPIIVRKSL